MKKLLMFTFIFFSSFLFSNINLSNAENSDVDELNSILARQLADLKKEMHTQNLVQYIEFESEIIIPKHVDTETIEYMYDVATQFKIPIRTAFRLIYKESNFRDSVTSYQGAGGFMQLMPRTRILYRELLRTDTLNLDKNKEDIYIGMYLLKESYMFWRERGNPEKTSWKLSLATYNAGKGTVLKYRGIPPYRETQDFVIFISKSHSNPVFYANYIKKYDNPY